LVSRQLRIGPRPRPPRPADAGTRRSLLRLGLLNLPYALHFDVLEVALPAVLAGPVGAPPAWSGVIFAGNTIMVLGLQIPLIRRLSRWPRRTVLSASGVVLAGSYLGFLAAGRLTDQAGGAAIAVVSIVYTLGEIAYTGSGTALVLAVTPPHRHGRTLARWELSTGLGKATAPAALAGLLAVGDVALWAGLALLTAAAAAGVHRFAPDDARGAESRGDDAPCAEPRPDDACRAEPRPVVATPDPAVAAAAARGARAGG
jgi:MFS family permease